MKVDERITALKARHADLEEALQQEIRRPLPNSSVLTDLKRQKLRIKDEIHRLSKQ
ncbi:MAG: YdcH family protein [Kiloniellales bacterium]